MVWLSDPFCSPERIAKVYCPDLILEHCPRSEPARSSLNETVCLAQHHAEEEEFDTPRSHGIEVDARSMLWTFRAAARTGPITCGGPRIFRMSRSISARSNRLFNCLTSSRSRLAEASSSLGKGSGDSFSCHSLRLLKETPTASAAALERVFLLDDRINSILFEFITV